MRVYEDAAKVSEELAPDRHVPPDGGHPVAKWSGTLEEARCAAPVWCGLGLLEHAPSPRLSVLEVGVAPAPSRLRSPPSVVLGGDAWEAARRAHWACARHAPACSRDDSGEPLTADGNRRHFPTPAASFQPAACVLSPRRTAVLHSRSGSQRIALEGKPAGGLPLLRFVSGIPSPPSPGWLTPWQGCPRRWPPLATTSSASLEPAVRFCRISAAAESPCK